MAASVKEFEAPNPVTENRSGLIGADVDRIDGPLKVSGRAPYAYDVQAPSPPVYGVMIGAAIAYGRVSGVDTAEAAAQPGVLLVWTHQNVPAQAPRGHKANPRSQAGSLPALASDQVHQFGQPVAFVAATSFEAARGAADLIRLTYEEAPAEVDFWGALDKASGEEEPDRHIGDFPKAFAEAEVQIDETWTTPVQNHCQMEPCASLCWWEGETVIAHTSNQMIKRPQHGLAETLMVPRENVRLLSRYVGGGFGGKASTYEDLVLAALASRALQRPVKVAFTRQQMFHATVHRSASVQRVRLGATRDGRLTAMSLMATVHCGKTEPFTEHAASFSKALYAAPNRLTGHRLLKLDLPQAGALRAPGEAIGMLSLECAMDELAEKLAIDPIELRILNEPDKDPDTGRPFSTRQLVECYREGASRFGWARRNPTPGRTRDGDWLIGMGTAAAIRGNYLLPAKAMVRIDAEGTVTVSQAMTDIGTGTYTILAQITAETMGLPLAAIKVELGDSTFAPAPGSGGSFGAASAGSAVLDAGMQLRAKLAKLACADPASPLHGGPEENVSFHDGLIAIENRSERLSDLVSRLSPAGVEAEGAISPPQDYWSYAQYTYGAHFCEVGVDRVTGEVRLRRMLGVFAAGRILNAKTAKSQLTGGQIWGVGGALTEANPVDPRYGSFLNQDLGSYLPPVNADIVDIDAIFLPEVDQKANPMGIKGVGELSICGAGAAVANAVYNACGVRVRDYPITLDKVLAGLP